MGIKTLNVKDLGAAGDGVADDTDAIVQVINIAKGLGGATVYFPQGAYAVTEKVHTDPSPFDLTDCANLTFLGDGMGRSTIIILDGATIKENFYLFHINRAKNITFRDLTIDGNCVKTNGRECEKIIIIQPPDPEQKPEQIHGIQIYKSSNILVERVEFSRHFSDGIRLLGEPGAESNNVKIDKCIFHDNGRAGITCQRAFQRTQITNNYFYNISGEAIGYEPSGQSPPIENIVAGNIILHSTKTRALTLSGISSQERNSRTIVTRNIIINGGVQGIRVESILFTNNIIIGSGFHPALHFPRAVTGLTISGNYIFSPEKEGIVLSRGGQEFFATDILISGNQIRTPKSGGIELQSVDNTLVTDNKIIGGGIAYGVLLRNTTTPSTLMRNLSVHNNTIQNFTEGIRVAATEGDMESISILGNMFYDTQDVQTLTIGVSLHKAHSHKLTNIHVANNTAGNSVTNAIVGLANVDFISVGGAVSSGPAVYMGASDKPDYPEGVVPAPIGSLFLRTDDTAGSKFYVKESGDTGPTGWIQK